LRRGALGRILVDMENMQMKLNFKQAMWLAAIIFAAIGGTVLVTCGPLCALVVVGGALVVGRMQS
jgi:hypothetical protein